MAVRRLPRWPLLAAVAASACGAGPTLPAADFDDPEPEWERRSRPSPLLWRVTAPSAQVSYVFGTIHIGVSAAELSPLVWRALEGSEVFAMEADVEAAGSEREPDGSPAVGVYLTRQQLERLSALVGEARAEALVHDSVDEAYSAVLQALHPASVSMDLGLARAARGRGTQVRFLEDWRYQLQLGRTYFTVDDLREFLAPQSQGRREVRDLIAAYRRGDINEIEEMALPEAEIATDPRRFGRLYFARNRAWAERVEAWMNRRRCFLAVGVGHLPGERGLLRLLERRGFRVERVVHPDP